MKQYLGIERYSLLVYTNGFDTVAASAVNRVSIDLDIDIDIPILE